MAQNLKQQPLNQFLQNIQNKYDVVFTFADESIHDVTVNVSSIKDLNLRACLQELEQQTNLIFMQVNSRYIAIQKKPAKVWVSGKIRDGGTNEYLEGAYVYTSAGYALSNANGEFSISVNQEKDSVVTIRHTGYQLFHLKKEDWGNDKLIVGLVPELYEIEEVVVNYIAKGLDKLPDGSIQLNVKNLEVLPGLSEPDVLHTVQVLPGIQSISETVADINTRGGTNDQSLVLWEGIKMYQTGHFFGLISAFNSHLINKTRIVKNGANAYFDEGVSGIIDMKQQDFLLNEPSIDAGVNMVSGDIIVKTPVAKKLSLIVGARHSINDLFLTPTYKSYYERAFEHTEVLLNQQKKEKSIEKFQDFSFFDVSGKLLYDVNAKNKIRFSFLTIDNNIGYEENKLLDASQHSRKSNLNQSSFLADLSYSHYWNSSNSTALSAYLSHYILDGQNESGVAGEGHLQENEVTDWGLKFDSKISIAPKFLLLTGYQFKEVGIRNLDNIRDPGYFRDAKDVLRIHALYAEAETKKRLGNLYVRSGLRTKYYTKFESFSFDPSIVLNFMLSKYLSLELLAERKSQHTTQQIDYQTDFLGVEKRRWVLANQTSVPLITSNQISFGLQHSRNNLLVAVEGYNKKVKGIIAPSQGFQNQFQSVHAIGEYSTMGVELLVNKRFANTNFWANYTLAKNDYNFPDFNPSVFPNNFDIRHLLSLGGTFSLKQFEVSGGFNYRTGKPFTKPTLSSLNEDAEIVYEVPNASRLNEYIRFDVSAKYNFAISRLNGELGISVWNVFNRDNVINIYYLVNENNEIEQITRNALNITPNVNLRLRF